MCCLKNDPYRSPYLERTFFFFRSCQEADSKNNKKQILSAASIPIFIFIFVFSFSFLPSARTVRAGA